jgi:TIR domain
MRDHVFICYAREDEAFVLQLGEKLKGRGVPVWLDQWDIPPGSDWDRSIDDAIYDCGKFIIVLSPQAVESTEVRGELRTALDENKRIIPVIHSTCRVPRQLRTIQHVDFTTRGPDDESTLKQLLRTLETSTNISVARQVEATDKTVQKAERARAEPEAKKKEELRRAQAEHAAKTHLPPGTVFRDRVKDGSQGPEMVLVPAGTFKMGDIQGQGRDDEKPVHRILSFYPNGGRHGL